MGVGVCRDILTVKFNINVFKIKSNSNIGNCGIKNRLSQLLNEKENKNILLV